MLTTIPDFKIKSKQLFLFAFILFASLNSFAQKPTEPPTVNVVGGSAAENIYPFFANIQDPGTPGVNPFCGGSLIAPQWILTAGHCAINFGTGQPAEELEVVLNTYKLSGPNANHEKISSDFIAVHKDFNLFGGDLSYDIALIHLSSPSLFSPLVLPTQDDTVSCAPGEEVRVIGYGIYDTANIFIQPDTLQAADVHVISNTICNDPGRYAGAVRNTMLCAGRITGSAIGAGAGDSGGPLMVKVGNTWLQVGIVSWGALQYSTANFPGIYTRVSAYKHWIDSTIADYESHLGLKKEGKFDQPKIFVDNDNNIKIHFSKELPSECNYTIYDMSGRMILSDRLPSVNSDQSIPAGNLAKGLYVLKVDAGNYTYATAKFIK